MVYRSLSTGYLRFPLVRFKLHSCCNFSTLLSFGLNPYGHWSVRLLELKYFRTLYVNSFSYTFCWDIKGEPFVHWDWCDLSCLFSSEARVCVGSYWPRAQDRYFYRLFYTVLFIKLLVKVSTLLDFRHFSVTTGVSTSHLSCLFVTSKATSYSLSPGSSAIQPVTCKEVAELHCNHEEADTQLLLHASHAANMHERIVVRSPDTDVFLLSIAMQQTIRKELFMMMTGTGNTFR